MKFKDVKTGKDFEAEVVEVKERNGKLFAIAKSPNGGHEVWKPITRKEAEELEK